MTMPDSPPAAPLPRTFWQYVCSFGPGLVIVLTWLGAGDIVECGVAGGNYGYALMWIIVVALLVRFLFVSLIAKYQLCNERREGVLDGLARLHPWYAPLLWAIAIVMGHVYGAYMVVGVGETWTGLTGRGQTWQWAIAWTMAAMAIVFRPVFARIEKVFLLLLALLTVSLLGTAIWAEPSPAGIVRGTLGFEFPSQVGPFDSLLLVIGMLGAVGGSIMNLVYPYFLDQKGWQGPQYRRVQMYDFLLGIVVMIVLDLAVWTLGAELVHGSGQQIHTLDDLSRLLSTSLGQGGRVLFYLGVFAAVYTSIIGHSLGLALLGSHAWLRWQAGGEPITQDYRTHWMYRWIAMWILVSPLVWTMPGMPGFVRLTLISNSAQVMLVPILAIGLFWITASSRFIGREYRNRWWENLVMIAVLAISLWGAYGSVKSVWREVNKAAVAEEGG
jgi:Mn2+/Fe2+ NRAMP family transporter